jgi:hypothetical protein
MKNLLWIILLLPLTPLFARDKKLGGYVLDRAAFGKIQSYCVDTQNMPPREVKVINQFVARESRPEGLLIQLSWHRLVSCRDGAPDAIVRLEFPHDDFSIFSRHDVNGVLFVFRPGSPSPIYETQEVSIPHLFNGDIDGFDTKVLEHEDLYFVVRILIHDWQKLSENLDAAAF